MHHFLLIIKRYIHIARRENAHKIILPILLVYFAGSAFFVWFEKDVDIPDALWWSIVTMTTVGYGDISPIITAGRITGILVMLFGIGFLGVFTAAIAGLFIENRLLVQAALDHGVTGMISELVSNKYDEDLYKITPPSYLTDKDFFSVMCQLKQTHNIFCIGIDDKNGHNLITNPDSNYKLKADDRLVVISKDRPDKDL